MFNHQARWDRELPQDQGDVHGAAITVHCDIRDGSVTPRSFVWNKEYVISDILFKWEDRRGRDRLVFFSVRTQGGTYQIVFSREHLSWHLLRLAGP